MSRSLQPADLCRGSNYSAAARYLAGRSSQPTPRPGVPQEYSRSFPSGSLSDSRRVTNRRGQPTDPAARTIEVTRGTDPSRSVGRSFPLRATGQPATGRLDAPRNDLRRAWLRRAARRPRSTPTLLSLDASPAISCSLADRGRVGRAGTRLSAAVRFGNHRPRRNVVRTNPRTGVPVL
jgi:hypothetical protein